MEFASHRGGEPPPRNKIPAEQIPKVFISEEAEVVTVLLLSLG